MSYGRTRLLRQPVAAGGLQRWKVERFCLLAPAQIQWITFHSGYDFGYLLKILTCQPLPATDAEFFEILQVRSTPCLGLGAILHFL